MSETLWAGDHLTIKHRGGWEYAARTGERTAAVVLAVEHGHALLVEQPRPALGCRCLELPAGLVGDEDAEETAEAAAARELEEETGWRAARLEPLGTFASAPGLTNETFSLWRATGLSQVGEGGGVVGEDIVVHRVALDRLADFVAERRRSGVAIDVRLLLLLGAGVT